MTNFTDLKDILHVSKKVLIERSNFCIENSLRIESKVENLNIVDERTNLDKPISAKKASSSKNEDLTTDTVSEELSLYGNCNVIGLLYFQGRQRVKKPVRPPKIVVHLVGEGKTFL